MWLMVLIHCDRRNFIETVRDINDPNAATAQHADDAEQSLHLAICQGRHGLIHCLSVCWGD